VRNENVENIDVVQFPVGNMDEFGNTAAQIQERVQFDGALGPAKSRPRKQGEAQVDGGGVEGVHHPVQVDAEVFVCIQTLGGSDENLRELGVHAPVSILVRVGERAPRDPCADSHVVKLRLHRPQASFDVSQAFPVCELSESHAEKLIQAGKLPDLGLTMVTSNALVELPQRQEIHHLRKDSPSRILRLLLP